MLFVTLFKVRYYLNITVEMHSRTERVLQILSPDTFILETQVIKGKGSLNDLYNQKELSLQAVAVSVWESEQKL